jgi:hypothetical protein
MNRQNILRNLLPLLFLVPCFVFLSGCESEKPTTVRIESGPSFALSGSGKLASFTVSGPLTGQKVAFPCGKLLFPCSGLASIIWQIDASNGYVKGTRVDRLRVTLGKLPEGYTQTVPSQSSEIPNLPVGVIYAYSAETTNAAGQNGYFYMGKSGAVVAGEVPELCATLKEGREVRVNCTTKEPFQEPTNLESFVGAHQKH